MKVTIGIYDDHDKAIAAAAELKNAGYPTKHLSIIGNAQTEVLDDNLGTETKNPIKPGGLIGGTAIGATLGILTGVGLFAIPGLGFLFGAGALVGAIAGLDIGLIGGGIATLFTSIGVAEEEAKRYHKELESGKYLLIAQGSPEEVIHANKILHGHGRHSLLTMH